MPDFIDKDAFLKDVLPECKYPEKLISQVERQPIVHIDDMTFKIQNDLQAAKPSRIVEITFVRHGRWIRRETVLDTECKCSVCGYKDFVPKHDNYWFRRKFCPNCGADMREEGADNG